MNEEDDLEEGIARLSKQYDGKREARAAGILKSKKNQEEFLLLFQETAKTINSMFERAERASTDTLTLKAWSNEANEISELRFTVKNGPDTSISGRLRYRADLNNLQVFLEKERTGKPTESRPVGWQEITPAKIKEQIIYFGANLEA